MLGGPRDKAIHAPTCTCTCTYINILYSCILHVHVLSHVHSLIAYTLTMHKVLEATVSELTGKLESQQEAPLKRNLSFPSSEVQVCACMQ